MISDTIKARNSIHGDWANNARIANMLKLTFHGEVGWEAFNVEQQEALDLIAVKLSRILSGDPNHADHWHDVAGYATLGERACRTEVERMIKDAVDTIKGNINSIPAKSESVNVDG
jgi:hypothetical protein